jgi:hypothetical protein
MAITDWRPLSNTHAIVAISDEATNLLRSILPTTCEWKATISACLPSSWHIPPPWVDIRVNVLGYLPDKRVCGIHESHRLENPMSNLDSVRSKAEDIAFDVRDKIVAWLESNA